MNNEHYIQALAATAEPVVRRRLGVEVLVLVGILLVQLTGASFLFGTDKVAMIVGSGKLALLTKLAMFGVMAIGFTALTLWSLDPTARKTAPIMVGLLGAIFLVGLIGLDRATGSSIATTVYPQFGVRCIFSILTFALPVTLLLSFLMVRGASTQPNLTAALVGLSGGAWGAFTYAIQCPFTSIYYLGTWYVLGIAVITLVARIILPRVAKW